MNLPQIFTVTIDRRGHIQVLGAHNPPPIHVLGAHNPIPDHNVGLMQLLDPPVVVEVAGEEGLLQLLDPPVVAEVAGEDDHMLVEDMAVDDEGDDGIIGVFIVVVAVAASAF
ncbi:hypothetical protein RHGRI_032761 [Rhododendron griersonianum]|uniref:Uncharacterized protein n=1 Tax=Rhododendron griersonianum TaxID=479676 RepID=A0AAV6ID63_9ERIC|nr:hypothetical protein RHGRI_032761 [Rhododendron griersonianum]